MSVCASAGNAKKEKKVGHSDRKTKTTTTQTYTHTHIYIQSHIIAKQEKPCMQTRYSIRIANKAQLLKDVNGDSRLEKFPLFFLRLHKWLSCAHDSYFSTFFSLFLLRCFHPFGQHRSMGSFFLCFVCIRFDQWFACCEFVLGRIAISHKQKTHTQLDVASSVSQLFFFSGSMN